MIGRLGDRLRTWGEKGRFSLAFFAADWAMATWLLWTRDLFTAAKIDLLSYIITGGIFAGICAALKTHYWQGRTRTVFGRAVLSSLAALFVFHGFLPHLALPALLWLGAVCATGVFANRILYGAAARHWNGGQLEVIRWILLAGTAMWLLRIHYFPGGVGAGDTYWYTMMLADFVTQLRSGQFPVWVGQSVYAFNGAVSPLRLAPWFQHAGGLLDLVTFRALEFTALKNALLVVNSLAGIASAYVCIRCVVPRNPWVSTLLAIAWFVSPGVMAPLLVGDQYMTFMALPFLPVVLYSCWRMWVRDDVVARVLLSAGLAGLWMSHTPVAMWTSLLVSGIYVVNSVRNFAFRPVAGKALVAGIVFLCLGVWPIVSAVSLRTAPDLSTSGAQVWDQIRAFFPANFLPINMAAHGLTAYQLGYTIIGIFALACMLAAVGRARAVFAFLSSAVLIAPLTIPVPVIGKLVWQHIPQTMVAINNIWPMQRIFFIWSGLIIFAFAAGLASERVNSSRRLGIALVVALLVGIGWSLREAEKMVHAMYATRTGLDSTRLFSSPHNLMLVRYAYGGLGRVPGYATHGHTDPLFENRFLDRETQELVVSNADAAAPRLKSILDYPVGFSGVAQAGRFVAHNDSNTKFHNLAPAITLQPKTRYALRVEFTEPDVSGILQISGDGVYREYILPDSGTGLGHDGPPLAFGSGETNSRVIDLYTDADHSVQPRLHFITERRQTDEFAFADFWLYAYNPDALPIVVESWIPYRARVETGLPVWLESPRVWLDGWKAEVDGIRVPVYPSKHNLVMIPIEAGISRVKLYFSPRWWVRTTYWITLYSWITLCLCGIAWLVQSRSRRSPDAEAMG